VAAEVAGRLVRRGPVRAWIAPGTALGEVIAPDADADVLLTRPDCRIVKLQRKVVVGRIATADGVLWVKRYTVFAARVALASVGRASPAFGAWAGAAALAARGFATPEVVAAIEFRRAGMLVKSFFVTREVPDAETADRRWAEILADPVADRRRRHRRALARALGRLFGALHTAGVYHNDLKDVNVLVQGPPEEPRLVLLDLERVRVQAAVPWRRRVKNLVQLDRTLGRAATRADRARFLDAYLEGRRDRALRRRWAGAVRTSAAAKDRGKARGEPAAQPSVTCTVVCQDESAQIAACLETVAWCDELVVIDGGSRDDTVETVQQFTERVFHNPWPGYVAQKRFALEQSRGDWVLNLDADERVPHELATEIRHVLAAVPDGVDGFSIPRLVSYLGRWWYRGGWYPRPVLRLVRRSHAHWGGTDPHDRAEVPGTVRRLSHPLLHYTYEDVADHLRTVGRLTAVAAAQARPRTRVGAGRLVVEPGWRFVRAYLLKGGWREGLPGLFVAATDAFYVILRWSRVWERRRGEGDA